MSDGYTVASKEGESMPGGYQAAPSYDPYAQQAAHYPPQGPSYHQDPYGNPQGQTYYAPPPASQNAVFVFAENSAGSEDLVWVFPMAMLVIGLVCLAVFPLLTPVFWMIGAIFMVYPNSMARLMGLLNCLPLGCCVLLFLAGCAGCCLWIVISIAAGGASASSS